MSQIILAAQSLVVFAIAWDLQGEKIRIHAARGGALASVWPSIYIGLLFMPMVILAFAALTVWLELPVGNTVVVDGDEVLFSGDATEMDAERLANFLKRNQLFVGEGYSAMVARSAGQYTVSFALEDMAWEDQQVVDAFKELGQQLVETTFPPPLTFHLRDANFTSHETFTLKHTR